MSEDETIQISKAKLQAICDDLNEILKTLRGHRHEGRANNGK